MALRAIALCVGLGLLGLGPAPLSACAMLAGLPADCVPAQEDTERCEGMQPEEPLAALQASEDSCCFISAPVSEAVFVASQAPLPQAQTVSFATAPETAGRPRMTLSSTVNPPLVCPTGQQARLCVFLI